MSYNFLSQPGSWLHSGSPPAKRLWDFSHWLLDVGENKLWEKQKLMCQEFDLKNIITTFLIFFKAQIRSAEVKR